MNISLLPGNLLVVKDPDETMSPGGLHYPDVEHVHAVIGTVLMHERRSLEDLVGKRIAIQKWSERTLELAGTKFWLIREQAVLMVLED